MFMRSALAAVLFMVVAAVAPARAQLKIGDPAPALSFKDWVKGDPIDLGKAVGKQVILLEFWATWCPPCIQTIPHLTELQRKYRDRGLIVLGVSTSGRGETLRTVKRFVAGRGEAMDYTVAFDSTGETRSRYMDAVRAGGIPYAFLIDRGGRIVWHGHPAEPAMDELIAEVVGGKFDIKDAIMRDELSPMFSNLHRYVATREWDKFKTQVRDILAKDPQNDAAFNAMVYGYLIETDDAEGLREFVLKHIEREGDNPDAMSALAGAVLGIVEIEKRQPDLALRAAAAAYEACKEKDCGVLGTYARALFEIGLVGRAIELQAEAVALADAGDERGGLEKVLEYYKTCKALQSKQL